MSETERSVALHRANAATLARVVRRGAAGRTSLRCAHPGRRSWLVELERGWSAAMPATVIVGLQWGDKGKGKATDFLSEQVHWVVRYQGGVRENIERGLGLHASSRVLVALVDEGGMSREDAYGIVQQAAIQAADERHPLREVLASDPRVSERLTRASLDAGFGDAAFLVHVSTIMERLDVIDPGIAR